jgi:DNA-binding PadR family transcriptional regulator
VPNYELLRPHWFQILLALAAGPLHGTAIMEEVLERTEGEMKLWPGTLYGSLRELTHEAWIRETDPPEDAPTEGGRRRFYEITAEGHVALAAEVDRLASWVRVARARQVGRGGEPA